MDLIILQNSILLKDKNKAEIERETIKFNDYYKPIIANFISEVGFELQYVNNILVLPSKTNYGTTYPIIDNNVILFDIEIRDNIFADLTLNLQKRLQYEQDEIDKLVSKLGPEIQCPYCHSRNTKKISTVGRLFSVSFFGLGSSKVGKQWHCNKCGSDF